MSTLDELWAWIYSPLHELVAERAGNQDKSWNDLRAFFLDRAGLQTPSENTFVDELIKKLDEMPAGDRNTLLDNSDKLDALAYELARQYATTGEEAQQPDGPAYDEAAWQGYLARNGASWDGQQASWSQFKDWFLYYAAEAGVTRPATDLMNYLDAQAAPDRIATLARYGVIIQATRAADAAAPVADEPGTEGFRELFTDDPDFAALSPAEQRQTLIQVRDAIGGL